MAGQDQASGADRVSIPGSKVVPGGNPFTVAPGYYAAHEADPESDLSPIPNRYFELDEAAERVGKSPDTIRRWARQGKIHFILGRVQETELLEAEKGSREAKKLGQYRAQT